MQKINLLSKELTHKEIFEAKKLCRQFLSDILSYSIKFGNIYRAYNTMIKQAEIDNTIASEK
jgi:hypothetical protein